MLVVECHGEGRGRRGGLVLLWNGLEVEIQSFSLNHIDAKVKDIVLGTWRFTGIYGYPEDENMHKTGQLMYLLKNTEAHPWVCGGDFNLMTVSTEKKGGNGFNENEACMFREALQWCNLMDLGYVGYDFTWSNNRGGEKNVQERLDRFVVNEAWKSCFSGSFVSHLEKRRSDHLPILLCVNKGLQKVHGQRHRKLYRFEEMWTRDEGCNDVIVEGWSHGEDLDSKMAVTTRKLCQWSREKFGNFAKEMRNCKSRMAQLMEAAQTDDVIAEMRAIDNRMDELESREEVYWKQRSR